MLLTFFAVVAGFVGIPELFAPDAHALEHFLAPVFAGSASLTHAHHLEASTEWILMGTATVLILIVILYAVTKFKKYTSTEPNTGIAKVLENKWYIDELYETAILNPLNKFAGILKDVVEKNIIDGAVNGTGKVVQYSARKIRLLQSGQVGYYILFMVLSIIVLFLCWFNDLKILSFFFKLTHKL